MSRNKDRLGMGNPQPQNIPTPPQQSKAPGEGFSFVVPTEFVELPSKGRFYSPDHPLHMKETVEIKQMTAKEEDLLTSRSLLKKGVALERVIESVLVGKNINPATLLVGDRNAIVVALRVSGYGNDYETQVSCPACGSQQKYEFDLNEIEVYDGDSEVDPTTKHLGNGFFSTKLPQTEVTVVFRLLSGADEQRAFKQFSGAKKRQKDENLITSQLRTMIVSVNDSQEPGDIHYVVENMPSSDARHLRLAYKLSAPNLDMTQDFACISCGQEQELEVPLTADFFWPDR